jgi:hypothetical protein
MKTLFLFKTLERINGKTYFILTKNKKMQAESTTCIFYDYPVTQLQNYHVLCFPKS